MVNNLEVWRSRLVSLQYMFLLARWKNASLEWTSSLKLWVKRSLHTQKSIHPSIHPFMKSCMTTYGMFYAKASYSSKSWGYLFVEMCGSLLNFSTLLFLGRVSCHCFTSEQFFVPVKPPFTTLKPHLHYRKKWVRTHKKVGTDQIFLPCKPSVPCFHEMDTDSPFSGFGVIGGYGPKTEKKRVPIPFTVRKRSVNASSFRTIVFMWACRALWWFRACVLCTFQS